MTAPLGLLVATTNVGKIQELRELLRDVPVVVIAPDEVGGIPDVVEDGLTFEENARKKAAEIARAKGIATLADDSGLEVDALGGAPGVRSARFSEPDPTPERNNQKLLEVLRGVPPEKRTARFRCALALARANGEVVGVTDGSCDGSILDAPRGRGGFGYDPLFVPEGGTRSMAELSPPEKQALSHRGRAMRALLAQGWLRLVPSSTMVP